MTEQNVGLFYYKKEITQPGILELVCTRGEFKGFVFNFSDFDTIEGEDGDNFTFSQGLPYPPASLLCTDPKNLPNMDDDEVYKRAFDFGVTLLTHYIRNMADQIKLD